jgi:hypothetical protein
MAAPGPLRPARPHPGRGGAGRIRPHPGPLRRRTSPRPAGDQVRPLQRAQPRRRRRRHRGRPAVRGPGGLRPPHVTAGPGDGGTGHRGSRCNPPGQVDPTPAYPHLAWAGLSPGPPVPAPGAGPPHKPPGPSDATRKTPPQPGLAHPLGLSPGLRAPPPYAGPRRRAARSCPATGPRQPHPTCQQRPGLSPGPPVPAPGAGPRRRPPGSGRSRPGSR